MSKFIRLKGLAVMAVCVMGAFFAASCTSEEFFGIEEDNEGVDYSLLKSIALSKEYVEYQKQSFLTLNKIHSIDSTKKVLVDYYEGKSIYAYEEIVSIEPLFEAYQKLIDLYPEYENTNVEEKQQISRLSICYNNSLRRMSEKYQFSTLHTKSCSPESLAYQYAQASDAIPVNSYIWRVENVANWYGDDFYANIINAALCRSENGREIGGMFFSDFSGLLNEDFNATPIKMTLYYDERISFQPIADFHVHPNGNLDTSLDDIISWAFLPWNEHYIITKSECARYGWDD